MKTLFKINKLVLVLVMVAALGACKNDDKGSSPLIVLTEANLEGDEVCCQANVMTENGTKEIVIDILDYSNGSVKVSQMVTDKKYIGVMNIDGFHVHVNVADKGVVKGDLLRLTITDNKDLKTVVSKDITAEEEDGDGHDHGDE